jgi:hypothetical protein
LLSEATATRPAASLRLREPTGGGVKHLVELSTIRWNCVNDQPEPIRKASPEVAWALTSALRKLLINSPLLADTIRAPRVPLYG